MSNVISIISPRNNRPSSDELKAMIKSTKGRFFSADFIKSDGTKRHIVARMFFGLTLTALVFFAVWVNTFVSFDFLVLLLFLS